VAERLNPNGNPVRVGDVLIRTPGLTGEAAVHSPGAPGLRAAEATTDQFEAALASESVQPQQTIEITNTREVSAGAADVRATHYDEPAMEIEVPDPGEGWGQMVLMTDESGVMTWNFARSADRTIDTTRGGGTRRYLMPRTVPPPTEQAETRGLVGAIGKKVLKVLAFPILDPIIGEVSEFFAARWEAKKRPYRIRSFSPSDYRDVDGTPIENGGWDRLSEGPALLFIHGTFSQAHTGFGSLASAVMNQLDQTYGGRVFAFDHFTLSDDPFTNIEWFLKQVPDGTSLDLHIVCHSRGGLVGRVLAEKQKEISLGTKTIDVGKVVFVASPNAGTALADPDRITDFIDAHTNILNFFPFGGVTEILEGIITVAKHIAVGAFEGLEGLTSMTPRGRFLTDLNSGTKGDSRYYALAADYEPGKDGFGAWARDRLFDKIFGDKNDLVVPTAGVFDANGSGYFPVTAHVFDADAGIQHASFFSNESAAAKLVECLQK
jgi:pimeloyl-ACP methyl ester carboxylesterase